MNRDEIKAKVIALSTDIFRDVGANTEIIESADFVTDLGMDSITFITFIVVIETSFNIVIPDELLLITNFQKLENVIEIVENQLIE